VEPIGAARARCLRLWSLHNEDHGMSCHSQTTRLYTGRSIPPSPGERVMAPVPGPFSLISETKCLARLRLSATATSGKGSQKLRLNEGAQRSRISTNTTIHCYPISSRLCVPSTLHFITITSFPYFPLVMITITNRRYWVCPGDQCLKMTHLTLTESPCPASSSSFCACFSNAFRGSSTYGITLIHLAAGGDGKSPS